MPNPPLESAQVYDLPYPKRRETDPDEYYEEKRERKTDEK